MSCSIFNGRHARSTRLRALPGHQMPSTPPTSVAAARAHSTCKAWGRPSRPWRPTTSTALLLPLLLLFCCDLRP